MAFSALEATKRCEVIVGLQRMVGIETRERHGAAPADEPADELADELAVEPTVAKSSAVRGE